MPSIAEFDAFARRFVASYQAMWWKNLLSQTGYQYNVACECISTDLKKSSDSLAYPLVGVLVMRANAANSYSKATIRFDWTFAKSESQWKLIRVHQTNEQLHNFQGNCDLQGLDMPPESFAGLVNEAQAGYVGPAPVTVVQDIKDSIAAQEAARRNQCQEKKAEGIAALNAGNYDAAIAAFGDALNEMSDTEIIHLRDNAYRRKNRPALIQKTQNFLDSLPSPMAVYADKNRVMGERKYFDALQQALWDMQGILSWDPNDAEAKELARKIDVYFNYRPGMPGGKP